MMPTLDLLCPEQSTIPYTTMVFPDGQPHIKIDTESLTSPDKTAPVRIRCRIASANDLLLVLFAKNTLDYLEFRHVELTIAYLMTARMDRVMTGGEPFSLKVVAGMLNQARFDKISIFDPHSEVATALIDRCYAIPNHAYVKDALEHYFQHSGRPSFALVSPDAGALKKIHDLARYLDLPDIVECMKERDVRTGALKNFKTTTDNLDRLTCFIIDDICDGGGTFTGTAKMLKEKGAEKIVLIVSHGIFSKGVPIEYVDDIYTTSSFRQVSGCHCFPIERYC